MSAAIFASPSPVPPQGPASSSFSAMPAIRRAPMERAAPLIEWVAMRHSSGSVMAPSLSGVLPDLQAEQGQELALEIEVVVGVAAQVRQIENLVPCCILVPLGMIVTGCAAPASWVVEHVAPSLNGRLRPFSLAGSLANSGERQVNKAVQGPRSRLAK